jgi:hypothetical protein
LEPFTGVEFYKQFFCQFQSYVKKNRKKWNAASSYDAWTKFVKDGFLNELAAKLGFNEVKTEGIHGIDMTWKRSSDSTSVAIEHENDVKTVWDDEVLNLLEAAAPLKCLITYVNAANFPGRDTAGKLLKILKERNFNHEFLLILGAEPMNEPTDWIGYLYHPELTLQDLIFCSNMLEAEKSPGQKAWATRKKHKH